MELDLGLVEELAKLLKNSTASEIEVEIGDFYVRLKKRPEEARLELSEGRKGEEIPEEAPPPEEVPFEPKRVLVKSPYVGLFRPIVSEGEEVGEGKPVCYIEVVGVLSEVTSPAEGKVVSLLVGDGDPVGYGQILAEIEPTTNRGEGK